MDTIELLKAGGLGVFFAAVVASWNYRAAVWQWLAKRKASPTAEPSQADAVAKDYEALRYLESRATDRPSGWLRGCGQIRKAFLPPLKGDE